MTAKRERPALVWFRQDLRLSDNLALAAALERGSPVIPVYIWAPEEEGGGLQGQPPDGGCTDHWQISGPRWKDAVRDSS